MKNDFFFQQNMPVKLKNKKEKSQVFFLLRVNLILISHRYTGEKKSQANH